MLRMTQPDARLDKREGALLSISQLRYLRFLQTTPTIEKMVGIEDFDPNEKALFESIYLHWFEAKPLTVRQAINQPRLGSPTTLHKRLHRLIAQDLVMFHFEVGDRKSKYLYPSNKGMIYIEWLGKKFHSELNI